MLFLMNIRGTIPALGKEVVLRSSHGFSKKIGTIKSIRMELSYPPSPNVAAMFMDRQNKQATMASRIFVHNLGIGDLWIPEASGHHSVSYFCEYFRGMVDLPALWPRGIEHKNIVSMSFSSMEPQDMDVNIEIQIDAS